MFCRLLVLISSGHSARFGHSWHMQFISTCLLSACFGYLRCCQGSDTKRSASAVGRAKPQLSISVDCIIDLLVKHLSQVIKSKCSGILPPGPSIGWLSYVHESVLAWTVIHWLHWLLESHRKIMRTLSTVASHESRLETVKPPELSKKRSERPFLPQLPGWEHWVERVRGSSWYGQSSQMQGSTK